jgi:hypothetical protein
VNRTARERLRRQFKPGTVKVLFVGESPPAGGAFFYAADSELYRSTRDVFTNVFAECRTEEPFLTAFAAMGCYLVDFSLQPVNRLTDSADGGRQTRGHILRDAEPGFANTLRELQPDSIVVVVKSIVANVDRAIARAGIDPDVYVLTYPSRWHHHREAYRRELAQVLRKLKRGAAFATPLPDA